MRRTIDSAEFPPMMRWRAEQRGSSLGIPAVLRSRHMVRYASDHMYGAAAAFGSGRGYIFGVPPSILSLQSTPLELLGLGTVSRPAELKGSRPHATPPPVRLWNPSVAPAPFGLCARCALVVAVRVDALHQCARESSPLADRGKRALLHHADWFHNTAIALLDAELRPLGWTWLINSPAFQVAAHDGAAARATGCVAPGSADAFRPPWSKRTFDARLLPVGGAGELVVTYACSSCKFSLSPLQLTATPTTDGGLAQLRAWCNTRHT